jgi:hypothetical protein
VRVPAVRVESLDWTLVGGRCQLLRLLGGEVSRRDVLDGLIHEDHVV